jgi:hypothetical protein
MNSAYSSIRFKRDKNVYQLNSYFQQQIEKIRKRQLHHMCTKFEQEFIVGVIEGRDFCNSL